MDPRPSFLSSAVVVSLAASAVTVLLYLPQLLTDSGQVDDVPGAALLAWLVVWLMAAPVLAAVLSARRGRRTRPRTALLMGLPQLPVVLLLARLDVWLEVRSGYLLAGSGEEAMAYGVGSVAGALAGVLLTTLVTLGVVLGSRRQPQPRRTPLAERTTPR